MTTTRTASGNKEDDKWRQRRERLVAAMTRRAGDNDKENECRGNAKEDNQEDKRCR